MKPFIRLLALAIASVAVTVSNARVGGQAVSSYWYASVNHNGISPTIKNGKNWTIFRNVMEYGAKGDGTTDDTAAIQKAIDMGDSSGTRAAGKSFGMTGQPAVVYFPPGIYAIKSTISSRVGTVLMGDPTNLPTIKAAPDFKGTYLLVGHDSRYTGLVGFYNSIKNLVLDTTAIPSKTITILEWGVSQASQLSNVVFNMASGAAGHTGIATPGMCTQLLYSDLVMVGGAVGISLSVTQVHLKNIQFKNVATGVKVVSAIHITAQALHFEGCTVGIDTISGGNGLLNLIDSTAINTTSLVLAPTTKTSQSSIVVENTIIDSSTVKVGTSAVLAGSIRPGSAWVRGNVYATSSKVKGLDGDKIAVSRPEVLVNATGFYHTVVQPTYADFQPSQIVNIKEVAAHPVMGDGVADDAKSIQEILNQSVGKVVYFPYGIYLLSDTVEVPPGSRLVGEAFTQLSATGPKFQDPRNPRPMIRVGKPGDVGLAQMHDIMFTVADVLPGAVLVEVNMAGEKPGDVGFFFCNFRIGGAAGSKVWNNCARPQTCNAARLAAHLTTTSSSYWENTWAWSGDLDVDGGGNVLASPAGGFLIEAQKGTWMLGMGSEHHDLYQVNINNAKNVFIGLMEGETSHWQGNGTTYYPPDPWSGTLLPSDPDFKWCAPNNAQCRMGLYQIVRNSTGINLYSQGWWTFVMGPSRTFCSTDCQDNGAIYEGNSRFFVYGLEAINVKNLVLEPEAGGTTISAIVTHDENRGSVHDVFSTSVVAAYLRQSG
ncbi:glycoside hydrolase family 55 protein [Thozetella sp. PMI_491]|nr:glycoside hydrolase family 55 protein [Thozetella sp. PMI_491]